MRRGINYSKLLLGFSLCMAFLFSAGFHNKETKVNAAEISGKYADTSIYSQKYMEQCCPGIKAIGELYVTGGIMESKYTHRIPVYSVPYDTKIQGQTISKTYLPHGNIENLKEIFSSVTGFREFEWISGEYQASGAEKYKVVAYDDKNVIFWSNGYKAFPESPAMCHQSDIMMSHPPGFYLIPRGQVWMKLYKYDERNKYDAKSDGNGNIIVEYRGKGRVTSAYLGISSLPEYVDTGYVYHVKSNTELMIADTRKIYTKDKNDLYYKVIFRANNSVNYLSDFEYFYVQAKYLQKINKPVVEQPKPAPTKVRVKTIKNNQYVMTWNKPSGNRNFYSAFCSKLSLRKLFNIFHIHDITPMTFKKVFFYCKYLCTIRKKFFNL